MAYTYEELKEKTVSELRKIAKETEHEAVKGYTQLNKEHLLDALCQALKVDRHQHHDVVGLDKASIKAKIRGLKKKRDKAEEDHDHKELKLIRRKLHRLKRMIHKATV
ncbi:MAG: hypothetical protein KAT17_09255 [Candidatus Aminicenantes bacterium]|nr:hypothetical protein [Candidatus Aminicenantes bacterium]